MKPVERGRYLLRWRIADLIDGPRGPLVLLGIGAVVLAAIIVPLAFRPFLGREAIPAEFQKAVRCPAPYKGISVKIPVGASVNDPTRICVERSRAKLFTAGFGSFFALLFLFAAFLLRSGSRKRRRGRPRRWSPT